MTDKLKKKVVLHAPVEKVFAAWLDSKEHAAFTQGGKAVISPKVGGKYSAWDGYIFGKTLEIEPNKRIVQAWRTTEFPQDAPDSRLELLFELKGKDTLLTLIHTNIPEGQGEMYADGWEEYYFKPMKEYFK